MLSYFFLSGTTIAFSPTTILFPILLSLECLSTYEDFQTYKIEKYKSYMDSIKVEDVIKVIEKNDLI